MLVRSISVDETRVDEADPTHNCRTSNLQTCDYQNTTCTYNALFARTGHGPVTRTAQPPRLLLYNGKAGPTDEPKITISQPETKSNLEPLAALKEDHFSVRDYPRGTKVQNVMEDLQNGTVPLDPELRKKVDEVLEELEASEEYTGPEVSSDPKKSDDLNRKAKALEEVLKRKEDFWESVPAEVRKGEKSGGALREGEKGVGALREVENGDQEFSDDSEASTIILPRSRKTAGPAETTGQSQG